MKRKPLFTTILTLVLLIAAIWGGYALGRLLPSPWRSFAVFSTSYQDFADPAPMPTGDPKEVVEVPGFIQAFDVSPDGGTIAIAASNDLILYDTKTLKEMYSLPVNEQQVFRVRFSPDGNKLAVSGVLLKSFDSGTLRVTVWDTASWNILYEYESELQASLLRARWRGRQRMSKSPFRFRNAAYPSLIWKAGTWSLPSRISSSRRSIFRGRRMVCV